MSPLTCLHMNGHDLSTLAFPCTPVEEQNRLVQPSKRFLKKKPRVTQQNWQKAGGLKTLI